MHTPLVACASIRADSAMALPLCRSCRRFTQLSRYDLERAYRQFHTPKSISRSVVGQQQRRRGLSRVSLVLCSSQPLPVPEPDGSSKTYPEKIHDIVDDISQLTLLETAQLNELLKVRVKQILSQNSASCSLEEIRERCVLGTAYVGVYCRDDLTHCRLMV